MRIFFTLLACVGFAACGSEPVEQLPCTPAADPGDMSSWTVDDVLPRSGVTLSYQDITFRWPHRTAIASIADSDPIDSYRIWINDELWGETTSNCIDLHVPFSEGVYYWSVMAISGEFTFSGVKQYTLYVKQS